MTTSLLFIHCMQFIHRITRNVSIACRSPGIPMHLMRRMTCHNRRALIADHDHKPFIHPLHVIHTLDYQECIHCMQITRHSNACILCAGLPAATGVPSSLTSIRMCVCRSAYFGILFGCWDAFDQHMSLDVQARKDQPAAMLTAHMLSSCMHPFRACSATQLMSQRALRQRSHTLPTNCCTQGCMCNQGPCAMQRCV